LKLERDALKLRNIQGEIEAQRDEYIELYELAPLPAVTLDAACSIRRVNLAAAVLLGEVPERLRQKSFRHFVASEHRQRFSDHLARAFEREELQRCRLCLVGISQPEVPVELWTRFSPLRGQFELRVVDVREQERVREQARRLTESERAAREESATKDKFIAVLSHELRAPLTPVLAAASAQRRSSIPRELHDVFEMIERNVLTEARLIDELLDVNRIIRNKMQFECAPTDLHEIALQALENLRSDAEAKGQTLEVELRAEQRYANVDGARLRQALSNLLKNAVQFTPVSGTIVLSSFNEGERIAIQVKDSGIGIEPSSLDKLFEPFSDQRATGSGGLGLGLAISRGLVEPQAGRIAAYSCGRGCGSRFIVDFPTCAAGASSIAVSRPAPEGPAPAARPRADTNEHPLRILLIEDHADTVEVLSTLLALNGFVVEAATSVEAAREVDLERVDVIVSDIGLPDGTGLALMAELRTRARRPAIALTGFGMESDVRASRAAGFDLHLTKPVSIERLVDAIHSLRPKLAPSHV
jgi:signal transduction histidine kinase/ActR/RegA family two-component response regulator